MTIFCFVSSKFDSIIWIRCFLILFCHEPSISNRFPTQRSFVDLHKVITNLFIDPTFCSHTESSGGFSGIFQCASHVFLLIKSIHSESVVFLFSRHWTLTDWKPYQWIRRSTKKTITTQFCIHIYMNCAHINMINIEHLLAHTTNSGYDCDSIFSLFFLYFSCFFQTILMLMLTWCSNVSHVLHITNNLFLIYFNPIFQFVANFLNTHIWRKCKRNSRVQRSY